MAFQRLQLQLLVVRRLLVVAAVVVVLLLHPPFAKGLSSMPRVLLPNGMRVELFCSSSNNNNNNKKQRLQNQIRFLSSNGITSFTIVNKDKTDAIRMQSWIQTIREACLREDRRNTTSTISSTSISSSICAQYSLKHHKSSKQKSVQARRDHFLNTVREAYQEADEILLLGNNGPRSEAWNTLQALTELKKAWSKDPTTTTTTTIADHPPPAIAVSYNPYSNNKEQQQAENTRLRDQLETGCVSKIYIRFGTDLEQLQEGIRFCHECIGATRSTTTKATMITIAGSLVLPTPSVTKFRSNLGPEFGLEMVTEIVKLYLRNHVELVWEAPGIRTMDDFALVQQILERATTATATRKNTAAAAVSTRIQSNFKDNKDNEPQTNHETTKEDSSIKRLQAKNRKQGGEAKTKKSDDDDHDDNTSTCVVIFGTHDVRVRDNRALERAAKRYRRVLPVFLWTREERNGPWGCPTNTAVSVCLEDALENLEASLASFGLGVLYCRCEKTHGAEELLHIVGDVGATSVVWNRDLTPEGRVREAYRKTILEQHKIGVYQEQSSLLYDVDRLELQRGFRKGHFGTLVPFWNQCRNQLEVPRRPTPFVDTFRLLSETSLPSEYFGIAKRRNGVSTTVSDMRIIDISAGKPRWDRPIRERFAMSETRAHELMEEFVRGGMKRYEQDRSRADISSATSQLSPHIRIGTLSPNHLYWRIEDTGMPYEQTKTMGRRLIWRDLAYYQLACFPNMRERCIRRHYENMSWMDDTDDKEASRRFRAWKTGKTGYPIVDAAMRELYATGWMTQSLRMVVASFLVEYLRINWTKGCEWFHYTLVDADSAINSMMWQNAGKSGTDQWNFVLSPKTASQDPTGEYTRQWVPELSGLPTADLVHRPWEATEEVLVEAGVLLGKTYPHRIIVDLNGERQKGVENTLDVRRMAPDYNSDRGYDLIDLPNGKQTPVFTKKEYRIDADGNLWTERSDSDDPTTRKKKNRRKKSRKA